MNIFDVAYGLDCMVHKNVALPIVGIDVSEVNAALLDNNRKPFWLFRAFNLGRKQRQK